MTRKDSLSGRQARALTALLVNPSVVAAAKKAGLGEATLYRYLADPVFKAALDKRRDALVSSITSSLVGLAGLAIEALRDILQDEDASAAVKSRTALGWLAQMRQSVELVELVERVSKLEEALERE